MRATQAIYRGAGSPSVQGDSPGICRACGEPGTGQSWAEWVKPTFTDHDKVLPGEIVCAACLFCFDDRRDDLRLLVRKEKPQRMRNYSHFVRNGVWIPLSKGQKATMREMLLTGVDVAVIALSGQKHIAFRCPAGWWQIEEATVLPFPSHLAAVLNPVEELYQAQISKTEIATGRYNQRRILDAGLAFWSERELAIAPLRGSPVLELAIFLAQRKEEPEDDGTESDS